MLDKRTYADMNIHWGQQAEDSLIRLYLPETTRGTYIDVGAFHPTRYSNTYQFYLDGWEGINIDASADAINLFNTLRPRDVNLNVGISNKQGTMTYYPFTDGAYNTFDDNMAELWTHRAESLPPVKVPVEPLRDVLQKHLNGRSVDFMTIDVEGLELCVLESNDWLLYRPRLIVMEVHGRHPVQHYGTVETVKYLESVGYVFVGIVGCATFFLSNDEYNRYS